MFNDERPWFFGDATGEEAKNLLEGKPVGTFLVRFSENKPGCFAISFVIPSGEVKKGLITRNPGGYQVNGAGKLSRMTITHF